MKIINKYYLTTSIFVLLLWSIPGIAQVQADFDISIPNPNCVPLSISFTNNSSNAVSYSWTSEGIFFSDQVDPQKVYTIAGIYEICLTAIDDNGNTDEHCENVEVFGSSDISFISDVNNGCPTLDVSFTASSVQNDLTELTWDFGDGTIVTTTDLTVTHSYISAGLFDVNLTATNIHGCTSFLSQEDLIDVQSFASPDFSVDEDFFCNHPASVQFTNLSNGDLSNVSYEWNFGDGNISNDENPSYTYNDLGSFDVSLTIIDNNTSCENTLLIPSMIQVGLAPNFSYTINETCSEVTVDFINESLGDVVSFLWDFGDGNTSNLENPTHVYNSIGCYFPSLTVLTADGCTNTYTLADCIEVQGTTDLTYEIVGDSTNCQVPFDVSFTTDYTGNVEWDFGGAGTSNQQNPTFTFTEFGSYPIELTAILENGCEESIIISTVNIAPPQVMFEGDTIEGCAPLAVTFTDISQAGGNVVSWLWDFGNGDTSTDESPTYTFTEHGEYDISLEITLDNGCTGSITGFNYVQVGYVPPIEFSADPTETCIENLISFTDESDDENIDYWDWAFGDGTNSDQQHPIHEYNDTGYMDVQLIVGYNSCFDTLLKEDYVHLLPPKSIYEYTLDCNDILTVSFTDASIGADAWFWDMGDGTTYTQQNVTHTFPQEGVYLVNLQVYNNITDCYDDQIIPIPVYLPEPLFEMPLEGCIVGGNSVDLPISDLSENAVNYIYTIPSGTALVLDQTNDPEPLIKFTQPGIYTGFELYVEGSNLCSDSYILPDTVVISSIDALFTAVNIDINCNQTYQFNDESVSQFANIVAWYWDFGDGFTSTEQNPSHTYGIQGSYTPSLTVINDMGCSHTYTLPNPIVIESPFVSFDIVGSICLGDTLMFQNQSVATDFVSWSWDLGDGTTSIEWHVNHSYDSAGVYQVCFFAENNFGCQGTYCEEVIIEHPLVDFTADEIVATCSPHVVQFNELTDESIIAWEWDFGDNTGVSTLPNPTHTYTNSGSFTVCLTVTSESGCVNTLCKENYITVGGPTATVDYLPSDVGCLDYDMQFIIESQNVDDYIFDFGDGITYSDYDIIEPNFILNHTYTVAGEFVPVFIMIDSIGCNNVVILDTIKTQSLDIDFTVTNFEICEGETVDFETIINTTGNVQSIHWTFEGADIQSANTEEVNDVLFENEGEFNVSLNVVTEYCNDTITKVAAITVRPNPNAEFIAHPTSHCGATTIDFLNQSTIASGSISAYNWNFGNGQTSTSLNESIEFNNIGNYDVNLVVTSEFGCTDSHNETIHIYEPAVANASASDYLICDTQSTQLYGEGNGSFSWGPEHGLSCINCPNPVATPLISTTYILTVTTTDGCTATDSVYIEKMPQAPPHTQIVADTIICQGDDLQLLAIGGLATDEYSWESSSASPLSCYNDCYNPTINMIETTTFTITITNSVGCIGVDSLTVGIIGTEVNVVGEDRTICKGESVQLEVFTGDNPNWYYEPSLSCFQCENPVASPEETTTYTVRVEYADCILEREITVYVLDVSGVNAGDDQEICLGDEVTLSSNVPVNFEWLHNGNVIENINPSITVSPTENCNYILRITNDLCVVEDTVNIRIKDKLDITANDIHICEGDYAYLSVQGESIQSVEWFPALNLDNPYSQNPMAALYEDVEFMVIADHENCEADTAYTRVTVSEVPTVDLLDYHMYVPGETIQIDEVDDNRGTFEYTWLPEENVSCSACPNPSIQPEGDATYTLMVTNDLGCMAMDSIRFRPITDCGGNLIALPTAFSPNGDGQNDTFKPLGIVDVKVFRVFNRWGELVYESFSANAAWDGTFQGEALNTDVFVWYVETICPLDKMPIVYKGDVTLLR